MPSVRVLVLILECQADAGATSNFDKPGIVASARATEYMGCTGTHRLQRFECSSESQCTAMFQPRLLCAHSSLMCFCPEWNGVRCIFQDSVRLGSPRLYSGLILSYRVFLLVEISFTSYLFVPCDPSASTSFILSKHNKFGLKA